MIRNKWYLTFVFKGKILCIPIFVTFSWNFANKNNKLLLPEYCKGCKLSFGRKINECIDAFEYHRQEVIFGCSIKWLTQKYIVLLKKKRKPKMVILKSRKHDHLDKICDRYKISLWKQYVKFYSKYFSLASNLRENCVVSFIWDTLYVYSGDQLTRMQRWLHCVRMATFNIQWRMKRRRVRGVSFFFKGRSLQCEKEIYIEF